MGRNQFNAAWSEQELNTIRENYGKMTAEKLAGLLPGRTKAAVWKYAAKLGLKYPLRKLSNNDLYFETPNIQNCYWAGFIAADGCVNSNNIEISLQRKDRGHLERFVLDTEYTGDIKDISKSGYPASRVTVCSRKWISDLNSNFNIVPRKSKILKPPNINDLDLLRAYIVGYIDGDGCILVQRNMLVLNVRGSWDLLIWIKHVFDEWYPSRKHKSNVTITSNCPNYSISGRFALLIAQELNNYPVPKMKRKWIKVEQYAAKREIG